LDWAKLSAGVFGAYLDVFILREVVRVVDFELCE
jgi:hypothetical protein